jgi:hypothetical protein
MSIKSSIAAIILASVVVLPARADEESAQLKALVSKYAASVVTVNAILKTEFKAGGQAQDSESRISVQGIVVDSDGMVVVSNVPFSSKRMMEMFGGGGEEVGGFGFKMTPTGFKVIVEKEEREYDAFLVATDGKYDVAFIKIEGLGDRKLPAIDFSSAASPAFGDKVICVSRLGKGYDYAPYFQAARISGEIAKPIRAWMVDGTVSSLGLPVFTQSGEPIGLLSTVPSGVKEDAGSDRMGMGFLFRMFSGGGSSPTGAFLLPGAPIKALVEQAKVQAVTVAAERAKKKQAKPPAVPTTKPAAGKPGNAPKP